VIRRIPRLVSRRKNPYAAPDARTRQAKQAGYPARSVFKLQEIDRRVQLFRSGQRVLDLGAAPGSWSLYASQRIGESGRVLAVDLSPIPQQFGPNVKVLQADVLSLPETALSELGPYDVVLSDMAPSTSGSKIRDQSLSYELCMAALRIALSYGKPGSSFVGKLFMSEDFGAARAALAARYRDVKVIRPESTRQQSSEVFLVGKGLH
jgi:23S rRNA (uridine2552-2'-O)-methyltransferase